MPPISPFEPYEGTKLRIVEAALGTLKEKGFAGASARAIAARGSFNQALIFYHFGTVQNLLLAVLDLIGARRMGHYGEALRDAATPVELAELARTIYAEDLEQGYVTVLVEMVSGAGSDPELAAAVALRIEPWIEIVEAKISQLIGATPLAALASPSDLAFGLVAGYFGVDLLSHMQRDPGRAESLLDLATRLAGLAQAVLPSQPEGKP